MTYLLDANVFIQAKNLHYGLDFCPAFWEWLVAHDGSRLPEAACKLDAKGATIYAHHMSSPLEKTTVYLESADYQRVKALADAADRSAAELIREAVAEYVRRRETRVRPRSIGAARSGRTDLSERAEELLVGFGEPT